MALDLGDMQERLLLMRRRANAIFDETDQLQRGWLSKNVLKKAIQKDFALRVEMRTDQGRTWASFWQEIDENQDGKIQREELVNYMIKLHMERAEAAKKAVSSRVEALFKTADADNSGALSKQELTKLLSLDAEIRSQLQNTHGGNWQSFWDELDKDGDGEISLEELTSFIEESHDRRAREVVENVKAEEAKEQQKQSGDDGQAEGTNSSEAQSSTSASSQQGKKKALSNHSHSVVDMTLWTDGEATASERIKALKYSAHEIFVRADKDRNGWLSHTELKRVIHADAGLRLALRMGGNRTWVTFWDELDENQDGRIQEPELANYLMKREAEKTHGHIGQVADRAQVIFTLADTEKRGYLLADDLQSLLENDLDIADELRAAHGRSWEDFWIDLDENGDGKVTLTELRAYILRMHNQNMAPSDESGNGDKAADGDGDEDEDEDDEEVVASRVLKTLDGFSGSGPLMTGQGSSNGSADLSGLAKMARAEESVTLSTSEDGRISGTPDIISPEDYAALRKQLTDAENKIGELETKLKFTDLDRDEATNSYEASQAQVKTLMDHVRTLEQRVQEEEENAAQQSAKCTDLQRALDEAQGSGGKQDSNSDAALAKLRAENAALAQEVAALKESLKKASAAAGKNGDADAELARQRARNEALDKELASALEEADAANKEVARLQKQLKAAKDSIAALRRKLDKATAAAQQASENNSNAASRKPSTTRPKTGDSMHKKVLKRLDTAGLDHGALEYVSPGKYTVPGSTRIINVREVGTLLMVRVGGGWTPIDEYLKNYHHSVHDAAVKFSQDRLKQRYGS